MNDRPELFGALRKYRVPWVLFWSRLVDGAPQTRWVRDFPDV